MKIKASIEREIIEKYKIIDIIKNTNKSSDTEDEKFYDSVKKYVSKAAISDTDSTFDFAQLELSDTDVIQDVKEKHTGTKKKDLQCQQCEHKCKCKNTLKRQMNIKHGAKRL